MTFYQFLGIVWVTLVSTIVGWGDIQIPTVPVANPGNAAELSGESASGGYGPDRLCGAVDYSYQISTYAITASQYTAFLNAVAGVDSYQLYNPEMWSNDYGCKIERYGGSGTTADPYAYRVAADWEKRPVNYVSWADAARFANWLHNGQPTGLQNADTTEDGAYALNGAMTTEAIQGITRTPAARWAIPTEDEWYKAAYHKNDGVTGHYFDYPTSSDLVPANDWLSPDPGNTVTYAPTNGDYTIGSPYWRTEVGEHEQSASPYGTFDQGGNVWEWNEALVTATTRGRRGGTFFINATHLRAAARASAAPLNEDAVTGFRVTALPEPASTMGLLAGSIVLLRRRR